jgi:GTP cyclohydrolase I
MVARAVGELLRALRVDLEDENFVETPRRVANYLLEHFISEEEFEESLEEFQSAVFPTDYTGMVTLVGVRVFGICPHHLLPVVYDVDIAYIPQQFAVGLSKLARLASLCLKQPLLQETATLFLADTLEETLKTSHVAVFIEGQHQCMVVRGVEKDAVTVTTELRGAFLEDEKARNEFLLARQSSRRR